MKQELVLYDTMRLAIAKCAAVDEAAGIKNKAAKLEAYARIRDDAESECQFAEIKLRAAQKIGEISRELEKASGNQYTVLVPNDGKKQSKEQTLAAAGISTSTANRYEELTGGREEQAQKAAELATDVYFANAKKNGEKPTMRGFNKAVKEALVATLGEVPPKQKRFKKELRVEKDHWFRSEENLKQVLIKASRPILALLKSQYKKTGWVHAVRIVGYTQIGRIELTQHLGSEEILTINLYGH